MSLPDWRKLKRNPKVRQALDRGKLKGVIRLREQAFSGKNRALFRTFARQYLKPDFPVRDSKPAGHIRKFEAKRGISKKQAFLEAFETTASITRAAECVGVDRSLHYHWTDDEHPLYDAEYVKAFAKAKVIAGGLLVDDAVRFAHEGYDEPVYQGGQLVGTVRKYESLTRWKLIEAWLPEYRNVEKHEITGPDGQPLEIALIERLTAGRKRVADARNSDSPSQN